MFDSLDALICFDRWRVVEWRDSGGEMVELKSSLSSGQVRFFELMEGILVKSVQVLVPVNRFRPAYKCSSKGASAFIRKIAAQSLSSGSRGLICFLLRL
jgi:hypothetical protein